MTATASRGTDLAPGSGVKGLSVLAVLLAVAAAGCASAPAPAPAGSKAPAVLNVPPPVADVKDVIHLHRSGVSDDVLLQRIRADGVVYDLTKADLAELRNAGVSERVIQAMRQTRARAIPEDAITVTPR